MKIIRRNLNLIDTEWRDLVQLITVQNVPHTSSLIKHTFLYLNSSNDIQSEELRLK